MSVEVHMLLLKPAIDINSSILIFREQKDIDGKYYDVLVYSNKSHFVFSHWIDKYVFKTFTDIRYKHSVTLFD